MKIFMWWKSHLLFENKNKNTLWQITKLWISSKLKNTNGFGFSCVCDKRTDSKVRVYLEFLKRTLRRALIHQLIIRYQGANIRVTKWKSGYLFLFSASIMHYYYKAKYKVVFSWYLDLTIIHLWGTTITLQSRMGLTT